jgi:DNA-binding NtrC family response regulator
MLSHELKTVAKDLSVLYVEDEEDTRIQISEILRMFFKTVIVAVNGKEGIEKFHTSNVDLILSDVTMPVMDGIELIKNVISLNPNTKTIVMTAHDTGLTLLEKENLHTTDILYKPIDIDSTLQLLYDVCQRIIKVPL